MTRHYYRDFVTSKIRYTLGEFKGWTKKTGLLNVEYGIFRTPKTYIYVPFYLLTRETMANLPPREK